MLDEGQRIKVKSGPDAGKNGTVVGVYQSSTVDKYDVKLDNGRNYDLTQDEVEPIDK